jgi:hypothetical protein
MAASGLIGRALSYLLAAATALVFATWLLSGDAAKSLHSAGERQGAGPVSSLADSAQRVGETAWEVTAPGVVAVVLVGGGLLLARTVARRRRRYRRYGIVPYRSDQATPEHVQNLFESWHQQLLPRWWRRLALGQPSIALEVDAQPDTDGELEVQLGLVLPEQSARVLERSLHACYPDTRLVERPQPPARPRRVIRLKKRYDFIRRLRTPRDYGPPLMDALLSQLAGLEGAACVQYVLTPAPAFFDRVSRHLYRASEAAVERARASDAGDPGLRSELVSQELEGGLAVQHRRLFFAELRVGAHSYRAARAVAGTLRGESSAENQLVERYMRPYGQGPLYARRMRRALGDILPDWRRGVLSSLELAGLWQLPSPGLKAVRLARSSLPRVPAPPEITRAAEHAIVRDERGPVGILPEDKSAGLGLIGGQNTGKTSAMCRSIACDARDRDCAIVVLDPKSDLARKRCRSSRRSAPSTISTSARPRSGSTPCWFRATRRWWPTSSSRRSAISMRTATSGRAPTAFCAAPPTP